jgi:hypothetical protein
MIHRGFIATPKTNSNPWPAGQAGDQLRQTGSRLLLTAVPLVLLVDGINQLALLLPGHNLNIRPMGSVTTEHESWRWAPRRTGNKDGT